MRAPSFDFELLKPVLDTVLDAVIVMSSAGDVMAWNDVAEETFGWRRDEALGRQLADLIIPVRYQAAHARGIARVASGGPAHVLHRRIEISACRRDGREFPIELAITTAPGDVGELFIGFLRDISARKADEARLALQAQQARLMFEISSMAAEAGSFEVALESTLQAICELSAWPVGHAFYALETGKLVSSEVWVEAEPDLASPLKNETDRIDFGVGVGLPGEVMQRREPIWVADTDSEENFPRRHVGFRAAFAFPLLSDDRVVAVLEFFSTSPVEPDDELLLMVRALGAQVGRVFERKRNDDHRALLANELTHRAKNTMAVIQGVAHQTFRNATSVDEARDLFEGRLAAMSAAHRLLADTHWQQAGMREIVEAAIGGCGSVLHRFRIAGPDFAVPARIAVSIALAIHELCTNAFKYGALSTPAGEVSISWERQESGFRFEWQESGGPPVVPPTRKGFGTSLLRRGLASELGGNLNLEFRPEGLRCTFDGIDATA